MTNASDGRDSPLSFADLEEEAAQSESSGDHENACLLYRRALGVLGGGQATGDAEARLMAGLTRNLLALQVLLPRPFRTAPQGVAATLRSLETAVARVTADAEHKAHLCRDVGAYLEPLALQKGLWRVADELHRWTRRQERLALWHRAQALWCKREGWLQGAFEWIVHACQNGGMFLWEKTTGYGVTVKPLLWVLLVLVVSQTLAVAPTPSYVADQFPMVSCMEWETEVDGCDGGGGQWLLAALYGLLTIVGQGSLLVSPANKAAAVSLAASTLLSYGTMALFVSVLVRKFVIRTS